MSDLRAAIHASMLDLASLGEAGQKTGVEALIAPASTWHVAYPAGDLVGAEAIATGWLRPLHRALPGLMRRDAIVMEGVSRTGSGRWLASLGHYVGNFTQSLFGIPPHGKLVFLRCGEFYRLEGDRIVEAFILPDLLDLMRQSGQMPLPSDLGTEMLFPSPASHDGVLPGGRERSDASAQLVEAMLTDLRSFEPGSFDSVGQTGEHGYWHRDMLWYGPGGVGSNFTYAGFQRDHRIPFLTAFPDRVGGNHFARFGDGDYVCSGGWPSMTMTHAGPYLGVPPSGLQLTMRVMDFWRVQDGSIRENWVLLDLPEFFSKIGVNVLSAGTAPA